jgi:hypothetical protein
MLSQQFSAEWTPADVEKIETTTENGKEIDNANTKIS